MLTTDFTLVISKTAGKCKQERGLESIKHRQIHGPYRYYKSYILSFKTDLVTRIIQNIRNSNRMNKTSRNYKLFWNNFLQK